MPALNSERPWVFAAAPTIEFTDRVSSNAPRASTPGFFNSMTSSGRSLTKHTKSGRQE